MGEEEAGCVLIRVEYGDIVEYRTRAWVRDAFRGGYFWQDPRFLFWYNMMGIVPVAVERGMVVVTFLLNLRHCTRTAIP